MAKNIMIFSDGTGQRSGIRVEERRSNVFKLYRASRAGPDSAVDPRKQFAFYDPGIGTLPEGIGLRKSIWRFCYNMMSQATGYGITVNIIDCYAAILKVWEPGDRIFLIGFSRGAYTMRCLASVLAHCGIPTKRKDGTPLRYDSRSIRKIAKEAVKKVYQHVSSEREVRFVPQRDALARRFREEYGSGGADGPNAEPYFVGVFDTVAALLNLKRLGIALAIGAGFLLFCSFVLWGLKAWIFETASWFPNLGFWGFSLLLFGIGIAVAVVSFLLNNLKFAFGLPGIPFWKTVHFNPWRFKFYDNQLSQRVRFARHAIAIDEHREDFDRVIWGDPKAQPRRIPGDPPWLKQVWFAGNHSDIGGSYPEPESRLSDIALEWMREELMSLPDKVLLDDAQLRLYPDPLGMQHDERKASFVFGLGEPFFRKIDPQAVLHKTVYDRLAAKRVMHFDERFAYRPKSLKAHEKAKEFFDL